MDFLDPKKKRNRKIRLAIGHALMVLLVFIATYILVFRAYGYDFNPKTGEVIQNGLVYIDSAPDGAKITINGQEQKSNTNTRIALPEGKYNLQISKDGYRTWSRDFELEGGDVLRLAYPVLFPTDLNPAEIQTFNTQVTFATQSPDRKWIILAEKNKLNNMVIYDLGKLVNKKPTSAALNFPNGLFNMAKGDHAIKLVEWSTDNRHLLVRHSFKGGQEFLILDREQPSQSYNINKTFSQNPASVSLFDKKFDKLFLYDSSSKNLSRADLKSKAVTAVETGIVSYKSHGDDTLLMSKINAKDKSKADIIMRQKNKDYVIKQIKSDKSIPLDIARYDNEWYVVIGVQSEYRAYIYRDPMDLATNNQNNLKSVRAVVLKTNGPIDEVSFSQNTRFIMSNSKQNFSVYDAETDHHFSYDISQKLDSTQKPAWMDGNRLISNTADKVLVFDFDGINVQELINADPAMPVMFNRDYTDMYSLGSSSSSKGKYALFITSLRLDGDR